MATAGRGRDFVDFSDRPTDGPTEMLARSIMRDTRPTPTGDYWEDYEAELDWLEQAPTRVMGMVKHISR